MFTFNSIEPTTPRRPIIVDFTRTHGESLVVVWYPSIMGQFAHARSPPSELAFLTTRLTVEEIFSWTGRWILDALHGRKRLLARLFISREHSREDATPKRQKWPSHLVSADWPQSARAGRWRSRIGATRTEIAAKTCSTLGLRLPDATAIVLRASGSACAFQEIRASWTTKAMIGLWLCSVSLRQILRHETLDLLETPMDCMRRCCYCSTLSVSHGQYQLLSDTKLTYLHTTAHKNTTWQFKPSQS